MPFDRDAAKAAGYTDQEINDYLGSKGQRVEEPGWVHTAAMPLGGALTGAGMLSGIPGTIQNALSGPIDTALNFVGLPTENQVKLPTVSDARAAVEPVVKRLVGGGPQTALENVLWAGGRDLTAASPMALLGPAGMRAVAQFAAGGMAGEAVKQYMGDSLAAQILGGVVGGWGTGRLMRAAGATGPMTSGPASAFLGHPLTVGNAILESLGGFGGALAKNALGLPGPELLWAGLGGPAALLATQGGRRLLQNMANPSVWGPAAAGGGGASFNEMTGGAAGLQ